MIPPIVSICLPVYEGAKYLEQALESLLFQSFENFEVLCADDNSTDSSIGILEDFARRDRRIQYLKNSVNKGLFPNYNGLLRQCKGKYIKPFAQDDILHKDCLARMVAVLDQQPDIALVSSARQVIDERGRILSCQNRFDQNTLIPGSEAILYSLTELSNWIGEPSAVMFRAEFFDGGFDCAYFHFGDIEYWLRILQNGDMYYLSEPLFGFRRHHESQTEHNKRQMLFALDMLKFARRRKEILQSDDRSFREDRRAMVEEIAAEIASNCGNMFAIVENDLDKAYFSQNASRSEQEHQLIGFKLLLLESLLTVRELAEENQELKSLGAVPTVVKMI